MKKIITTLIFILLFVRFLNCQSHFTDNYPLKVGNIFVHVVYSWTGSYSDSYYEKLIVTKDTIINSKKYFLIKTINSYNNGSDTSFYRIDSLSGNLLQYDPNGCQPYFQEVLEDSLWSKKQDRAIWCGWLDITCTDTNYVYIFGQYTQTKYFYDTYQSGPQSSIEHRHYAKGFGITYSSTETSGPPMGGGTTDSLWGCIINGILFGDTSIPNGIIQDKNNIPVAFSLSQNYPNPFNPTTKIKFDIAPSPAGEGQGEVVKLIIYDILGREVATLVNEELKPGNYEYEWNAGNIASGVYFYKLIVSNPETSSGFYFSQTKKLVLIK